MLGRVRLQVCFREPCHSILLIMVPVNLAFALALRKNRKARSPLRVGLLDLDIFGPSIPTLMGLQHAGEPALTESMYSFQRLFVI